MGAPVVGEGTTEQETGKGRGMAGVMTRDAMSSKNNGYDGDLDLDNTTRMIGDMI